MVKRAESICTVLYYIKLAVYENIFFLRVNKEIATENTKLCVFEYKIIYMALEIIESVLIFIHKFFFFLFL